jgi:superfamily II DNA or RNA helicase
VASEARAIVGGLPPPPSEAPPTPPRLLVADAVARLIGTPDERVRDALAAIPGKPLLDSEAAWALRLGPDRARTLRAIAARFELTVDDRSREELGAIAGGGGDEPVMELITTDAGESRLSLLDEWGWLWAEELRSLPGARSRPDAERVEVPLAARTAAAIEPIVAANRLRLSPAAEAAMREATGAEAPAAPGITLAEGGAHLVISADPRGELAPRISALPGARSLGRGAGRWIVVANPEAAQAIRELTRAVPELPVSTGCQDWLGMSPGWIAHVGVDTAGRTPRLAITTSFGAVPAKTEEMLETDAKFGPRRLYRLTAEALHALADAERGGCDLTWTPGAKAALEWTTDNPEAKRVPSAELDVVIERSGPRFVLEPIWDIDAETEFLSQEAAILRTRGRAGEESLPAEAWPPDVIARFIKAHGVELTPAARSLLMGASEDDADARRLLEMSRAHDAELEVPGLGGELMPFQRAGVVYALERRRVFLADEQGLGKTIQALATVQADLAYPAIVVAPASLKLNWLREIDAWLPGRKAIGLTGRKEQDLDGTDIIVLNYEIVGAHADALGRLEARALILDESHYVKNPRAARTRAVLDLAAKLAPGALRLALTGTPVVNRPAELASQLGALDRLGEYGSVASFRRGFARPGSRRRLHHRLRTSCYLRRRKDEVLEQLPAKRRAVVTVPISNEREYRRAERDFVRWLSEQVASDGSGRIAPDARAEALVKMTALRRLAAEGKLEAATEWIADFAETEERLVVFAHHRKIQDAVIGRFPSSARIVGSDSMAEREANVERFQSEDGPPLCVCSLEVASHGFTLTAAANVAFLELAWTPAKHDQAEDRTHRIGQERSVTAWYLLAAGTIDERIAALLAEKRDVVDSVTDGGEGGGASLTDDLIGGYAAEG